MNSTVTNKSIINPDKLLARMGTSPADNVENYDTAVLWKSEIVDGQIKKIYQRKKMQEGIIEKEAKFYVVDATKVAHEANLGKRTNTVLQTCFFAISGILPKDDAIQKIKDAIVK